MKPTVFADPDELGHAVATEIADGIAATATATGRRPYVLGCPAGRSAAPVYAALAELVAARRLDLSHLVIVMMDEYVEPATGGAGAPDGDGDGGPYTLIDSHAPHSCLGFGRDRIARPLSDAAEPGRGVRPENLWAPDPADPASYDDRIASVGGIDLFLLASGTSDGHVAMNPPGSPADSRTRVVAIPDSTRRDNLATFPSLGRLDQVPRHGVTVGIETIRRWSATAVMIVHGADKRTAAQRLVAAQTYDPTWPATVIADCHRPRLYLDAAAHPD